MKRLALLGFLASIAGVLAGCPIYDGDDDSYAPSPCADGYECYSTGDGAVPGCNGPADCGANETCAWDHQCHPGDCTSWDCVAGYVCTVNTDQTASCQPGTSGSGGGGAGGGTTGAGGGTTGAGGAGGGGAVWCGNPSDCQAGETCSDDGTCKPGDCTVNTCIFGYACDAGSKTCKPTNPAACGSDDDCAALGAGYACVSGLCTAPADQCFDQTQCPGGDKCAAGKCTPSCGSDADCPSGYACDTGLGICSVPSSPCTITNDCGSPVAVCVDGACVPRSDGGTCAPGESWVENGCIPSQGASFLCSVDGQQDACASGSICLHHSCYISCAAPNQSTCDNLPSFDVCKSVTTTSGAHDVCGSNQNLGGECDPTAGKECAAGKICIDGFCK
jgi:hypothetical protein